MFWIVSGLLISAYWPWAPAPAFLAGLWSPMHWQPHSDAWAFFPSHKPTRKLLLADSTDKSLPAFKMQRLWAISFFFSQSIFNCPQVIRSRQPWKRVPEVFHFGKNPLFLAQNRQPDACSVFVEGRLILYSTYECFNWVSINYKQCHRCSSRSKVRYSSCVSQTVLSYRENKLLCNN